MSKQIKPEELAKIVSTLLVDPASVGELDEVTTYADFVTAIAEVVSNYCGGEVRDGAEEIEGTWYVGIQGNEALPDPDDNIWSPYDPSGNLFEHVEAPLSVCSDCKAEVKYIIGCPDGAEICQECFDSGKH